MPGWNFLLHRCPGPLKSLLWTCLLLSVFLLVTVVHVHEPKVTEVRTLRCEQQEDASQLNKISVSTRQPTVTNTSRPDVQESQHNGQELPHISQELPQIDHKEVENQLLVFTRVPKTGSENFAFVLGQLGRRNGFEHKRYPAPIPRYLDPKGQKQFVWRVEQLKKPASYDRHVYFVDFRKFYQKVPLHFSMVRDPVSKFISRFSYARLGKAGVYDQLVAAGHPGVRGLSKDQWKKKDLSRCIVESDPECAVITGTSLDLTIPYFCGQHRHCQIVNSEWALKKAIENIQLWYPVVGLLEDVPVTLQVAERAVPRFFANASAVYYTELKDPHKNRQRKKIMITDTAKSILRKNLTTEYLFYNYIRERLYRQALQYNIPIS